MTYPSGRVVTYTYDDAGRPSSLAGQPAGGSATNYASSMTYHPHGAVEQMLLGNNKLEQSCYNSRLQPVGMRLSSGTSPTTDCANSSDLLNLAFGYGTSSDNNGNVLSQTIVMPKQTSGTLTLTQAYGYDGVNRLQSAGETVTAGGSGGGAWSFTHGYDQFGNMWVSSTTGLAAHSATPRASDQFGATTNRLTKAFDGSTLSNPYDEAGNLINHPYVGAMQYDAENRQKQFTSGSTTATYHYDGDGRRVKRVLSGQTTVYVYDAFGMLAAEYSTATPTETGGRRYRTTDHLGSTRLVTNNTGAVVSRHDYVPFGEELQASSSAGNRNLVFGFGVSPSERHKFTGKERDVESGLDYFEARYMSAVQGKFTSPDPYNLAFELSKAKDEEERAKLRDGFISNPQAWNRYAYTLNNPLRFTDPKGECSQPASQKENETGICIEAFIAQDRFKLVGRGDNRSFSATDPSLTARSRVKLTVTSEGQVTSFNTESARSGVLVKGLGLQGITEAFVSQRSANPDGSTTLGVSIYGVNGEAGLPFAPQGAIKGEFLFNISNSGSVTLLGNGQSVATTYPSWGVYSYEPNRPQPRELLQQTERNINDLQRPAVPVQPKVR